MRCKMRWIRNWRPIAVVNGNQCVRFRPDNVSGKRTHSALRFAVHVRLPEGHSHSGTQKYNIIYISNRVKHSLH
jgi:hypothetical protein